MLWRVVAGNRFVGYIDSPSEIGAIRKAREAWGFGVILTRECVTETVRIGAFGVASQDRQECIIKSAPIDACGIVS